MVCRSLKLSFWVIVGYIQPQKPERIRPTKWLLGTIVLQLYEEIFLLGKNKVLLVS